MKKHPFLSVCAIVALALPSLAIHAQERTASGSFSNEASWSAVQTMIKSLRGDLTILDAQVKQQKACNTKGAFWVPEHDKAVNGCVAPIVVDKETITKTGKSCSGLNCTVTINMTPYLEMNDVSVQATCMQGWCGAGTADRPFFTGSLPISTLKSSWNGERVIGNPPGTKNSSVEASYNAATKILTLKTAYNGKSTDANISQTAMKNVNIIVKTKVLQLPPEQ